MCSFMFDFSDDCIWQDCQIELGVPDKNSKFITLCWQNKKKREVILSNIRAHISSMTQVYYLSLIIYFCLCLFSPNIYFFPV